jgi:hypothetical protein
MDLDDDDSSSPREDTPIALEKRIRSITGTKIRFVTYLFFIYQK